MLKKILLVLPLVSVCNGVNFWNTNSQQLPIFTDVDLKLVEEVRLHDDNPDLFIQYMGLVKPINKEWFMGVYYKYVETLNSNINSNRIVFDVTYKKDWLFNRFRFEDILETHYWKYRNKIVLSFGETIKPFISDEVFLSCANGEFLENRLNIGFSYSVNATAKLQLSYMLQNKKNFEQNVVCFGTSIKF